MSVDRFISRDLERAMLRLLIRDKMTLQRFVHVVQSRWFTGFVRRELLNLIVRCYEKTKSVFTRRILFAVLQKRGLAEEKNDLELEWNLIQKMDVPESPEMIATELEELAVGREISDVMGDVVDDLERGEVPVALQRIRTEPLYIGSKGDDRPIVDVVETFEDRIALVIDKRNNPAKYAGVQTGFGTFDYYTGGLFKSEVTVIGAVTGVGKSTFVKMVSYNIIHTGKSVLYISNEENEIQVTSKFDALYSRLNYLDFKRGKLSDEEIENWRQVMESMKSGEFGRVYVKEIPQDTTVREVERAFYEHTQMGLSADVIVIDYMDKFAPTPIAGVRLTETGMEARISSDIRALSKCIDCPIVIPTQAATAVEEKQTKNKTFQKYDLYGSKKKSHDAQTVMGIMELHRVSYQDDREEGERDIYWKANVVKNRDGPPFGFKMLREVKSGFVREIPKGSDEEKGIKDPDDDKDVPSEKSTKTMVTKSEPKVDFESKSGDEDEKALDVSAKVDEAEDKAIVSGLQRFKKKRKM